MIKINIYAVGRTKERFIKEAINEYIKRLSKYTKLNIIEIKEETVMTKKLSFKEKEIVLEKEATKILKVLDPNAYSIVLDVKGKQFESSNHLATFLNKLSNTHSKINFIIGGSYGVSEKMLKHADFRLSFSNLTFTHQMVRMFLLEQIYRSYKINNNEIYDK